MFNASSPAKAFQDPYHLQSSSPKHGVGVHHADSKRRNAAPASGTEKAAAYNDLVQSRPDERTAKANSSKISTTSLASQTQTKDFKIR